MNPIDKVLAHHECKRTGAGKYIAKCPAHDDGRPSLAIREADNGLVIMHCFAGCEVQNIVEAMGLTMSDLFPDDCKANYNIDITDQINHERVILALFQAKKQQGRSIEPLDLNRAELAIHRLKHAGVL